MKKYFELFFVFFKIGAFTFGGGYAMLPIIEKELVEKRTWLSKKELLDITAVAQMTPGAIATNTATYLGFKQKGILGACSATFGVILPSIIIITLIYKLFSQNFDLPIVKSAFLGIRSAIIALILNSVIKIFKHSIKNKYTLTLFIISISILIIFNINPILIIVFTGIFSFILSILFKDMFKKML
ncbi:chromate transporter [Hypnocyclicus thermotrophus]|uniref:Chromate transporter n=1 Tax=Hypnocyclicus thermotrophus TaxID=1627895 RepID=A0AA46E074_9FUSO|nr:chromate transporter [Hypnocyclicus thermotrophus]TDT72270.1 chromate transporter [Hypnocyclicus thermotrophus]